MTEPMNSLVGAAYLPDEPVEEAHPDTLVGAEVAYDLTVEEDSSE